MKLNNFRVRGTTVALKTADSAPTTAARIVPIAKGTDGLELPVTTLAPEGLLDALSALGAKGGAGETLRLLINGTVYLTTGLGNADDIDDEAVRRAYGVAARALGDLKEAAASCEFGTQAVVEGLLLGSYKYAGFKSDSGKDSDKDSSPATVTVVGADQEEFERAVAVADSVNFSRDLVNTPAAFLYPEAYAGIVKDLAEEWKDEVDLAVEVISGDQLVEQGFGGIVAVGKGSKKGPQLVHVSYDGGGDTHIALVGKGITFDTGGISLKPSANMEDMISDMGGSAAQLGAIVAAAKLKLPVRVDAWLPMAENMPSGNATRPGDVITHYGGKTSEVLNTDAEGRLVLADAIARACEDNPNYLIEAATLTGAQLVALGARTTAVIGSDEFRDTVAEIGRGVGEPAWAMPLLEEQEEELKSPVADMRNVHNKRTGGTSFAGLYLSKFVPEDVEWVHLDIAGPAWNGGSAYGYVPARATGAPVRTIVETISRIAADQV